MQIFLDFFAKNLLTEYVAVGAGELRNNVPTLVRALNYDSLQVGEFSTSPVLGANLHEGDELRHSVPSEGDGTLHQKIHNPFEGGLVALDGNVLGNVGNHN